MGPVLLNPLVTGPRRGAHPLAIRLLVPVALMTLLATACFTSEDQGSWSLVNASRQERGLPALALDQELSNKAGAWATEMANSGHLRHSNLPEDISQPWTALGENVGSGPDPLAIHKGFLGSPSHYRTMMSDQYRSIGVGVAHSGDRRTVYVAHVFLKSD